METTSPVSATGRCKHWLLGDYNGQRGHCPYCALEAERERADYAWRNTRTIEAARQEEMRKRDAAEAEVMRLRAAIQQTLEENGHLADGENCTLIVLKCALKTPNDRVEGRDAASSRRVPSHDGLAGSGPTE